MSDLATIARLPARTWARVAAVAVVAGLAIGLPTDVIPNPVFGRSGVPVRWWDPVVLVVTAVLIGLVVALRPSDLDDELPETNERRALVGGLVGLFAVGCPTCNHVVVLLLGTSGALSVFQPLQPVLALGSIGLLVWALRRRLAEVRDPACAVPRTSGSVAGS